MKRYYIFFLVFLSFSSIGQKSQEKAKVQLTELKDSFILVRLKTNDLKIEALQNRGRNREAQIAKNIQYQENRETILSFEQTFDFCPIYFFYSGSSDEIRKGNLIGHVFDYELNLVDPALLQNENYFTAEFSKTENLGIDALVLMDNFLLPLKAPFPFFERKYIFFSLFAQGKGTMAKKYNKKLYDYHARWFPTPVIKQNNSYLVP